MLADVPCSGDGTIRKDPSVLPRWTPAVSNQIHAAQLEIAWRGLELLRVGGLMAYSTCRFGLGLGLANPNPNPDPNPNRNRNP